MSFRKILLAAVALPLVFATAAPVSAESLKGALAKAYANNPDLNSARAALRATDENVTIAKAGYRPQIGASASGTVTNVRDMSSGADDYTYRSGEVGISITQVIFDGFQTLSRVRSAESGVYAGQENLKANEIQILLSAVQAYADIARDQQVVAIRKQNLAFLNEQLNAAKTRLDVGEGTRTDVSQAEAQLAAGKALLAAAVAQLKISRATYVQIVGEEPRDIRQPAPASSGLPRQLDSAVQVAMTQHPSVKAALHAVDAAGYQVDEANGTLLPGVSLKGTVGRSGSDLEGGFLSSAGNDSTAGSITAQVTIPIYQGGAEYGRIRQAKENLGAQQIRVDSVRAQIQQMVVSAYAQLEAAQAAISANQQQLNAAKLALEGVIEERNVGQATTLDVLNAQQQVLNAKESLAQSGRNAVVASYSALAAMGRLTVADQGLQVAEYRSNDHYEAVKDKWFGLRTVDIK
ncbi:TolC family outer membrane protein [Gellertiella hungarica]|uniref:Outer membrane protein n=1 Tax=Gellertiella hungarica TaxID=1572859 RepID=A0A7W6J573_9HYPH|nr:outer membrane protein [Gellertiella hungarica]